LQPKIVAVDPVAPTLVIVPEAVSEVAALFIAFVPVVYETRSVVAGMSDGNEIMSLQLMSIGKGLVNVRVIADAD